MSRQAEPADVHDERKVLHAWIANQWDPALSAEEWHRRLVRDGWAVPGWPRRFGGRDAGVEQQLAYDEEMAAAGAPMPLNELALFQLGPILMEYGSPEQQHRYLSKMVSAEEIWCQGFSEPDAGSDLANVMCRAEWQGDHWSITGQKTWNTHGSTADFCMALVRTGPMSERHEGLSMMIVAMDQPGIEVRPIRDLAGEPGFNELYFTGARAPEGNVVGAVGQGWAVAMGILELERFATARVGIGLDRQLRGLVALAQQTGAFADARLRSRFVDVAIRVRLLVPMTRRAARALRDGEDPSGLLAVGKLEASQLHQELAELGYQIEGSAGLLVGSFGQRSAGPWGRRLLDSRMNTIAGGTTEIMRNVLARRALGLPRGT